MLLFHFTWTLLADAAPHLMLGFFFWPEVGKKWIFGSSPRCQAVLLPWLWCVRVPAWDWLLGWAAPLGRDSSIPEIFKNVTFPCTGPALRSHCLHFPLGEDEVRQEG